MVWCIFKFSLRLTEVIQTASSLSFARKSTKGRTETNKQKRTASSAGVGKENVFRRSLAFSATRLSTSLFVSVLSRRFSSKEVSLEAKKNLTYATYLNGVNNTLTFLPQTTPLSPAHGLMLQQQKMNVV